MKIFDMSERGIFMDITDVIVIGAGPAGLNAALYASRKELSVKIISNDIGGQMLLTSEIENYLGFESISGFDLADKMEAHVRKYPVEFITAAVMNLEKNEDGNFVLHLDDGNTVVGKVCIITAGKHSRMEGIRCGYKSTSCPDQLAQALKAYKASQT